MKLDHAVKEANVHARREDYCLIKVNSGVQQGCSISPVLFMFAVYWVVHRAIDGYEVSRVLQTVIL